MTTTIKPTAKTVRELQLGDNLYQLDSHDNIYKRKVVGITEHKENDSHYIKIQTDAFRDNTFTIQSDKIDKHSFSDHFTSKEDAEQSRTNKVLNKMRYNINESTSDFVKSMSKALSINPKHEAEKPKLLKDLRVGDVVIHKVEDTYHEGKVAKILITKESYMIHIGTSNSYSSQFDIIKVADSTFSINHQYNSAIATSINEMKKGLIDDSTRQAIKNIEDCKNWIELEIKED